MKDPTTIKPAQRMTHIEPFHVMELLALARQREQQGQHIVHMEIGEPDFVTPDPILHAAQTALSRGLTHYTPALGLPELRDKIAHFYHTHFHTKVDPAQIIITPGASGALMLALGVLVNPGDKVMMSDPGYPCNRHFVRLFDAEPVCVPVTAQSHYQLTVTGMLSYADYDTAAVMLATPSNPTGTILTPDQLQQWMSYAKQQDNYLIVDEIYQGLVYGSDRYSVAGRTDRAFVINSFSKYFCMTGWRLGWLVVPPGFETYVDKLAQNIFLAPSTIAQHAALAAFDDATLEVLEQHRIEFQQRRDFLAKAITELGFELSVAPEGAFYLYADCSRFTDDSFGFCYKLLEQAGVAITPGKDFGEFNSSRYVRFAYTTAFKELELGVERLRDFLNAR